MLTKSELLTRIGHLAFLSLIVLLYSASSQVRTPARPAFNHEFKAASGPGQRSASLPDTVRVLAVRVEFQTDNSSTTSGTGKFNTIYSYDYGQEVLDPYPHDRTYFQNHLRFLENYVQQASGGRTILVGTVSDSIITVSKQIKDYSPLKGASDKPVADLAVEVWSLVDTQHPEIDLSAYDMFVIFHAGKGRDVNMADLIGYDPTPLDIPSLSFTLDGFRKLYGSSYEGIPVRNGAFHITNSSIIPSNDSREIDQLDGSKTLMELTINGLLAASFGTYAGIPDLFNTKDGTTGIGRFGLMDGESIFAYGGICPPAPSAWEKSFLNWMQPKEAATGRNEYFIIAGRTDELSTADVLRVPVTDKEYWLVENRHRDPAGNGQLVAMMSGGREITMRFPKDTIGFQNSGVSALKGVVTKVEDLDWALPGGTVVDDKGGEVYVSGGLLIWHIDENVISANLESNTVNADPKHRGVDLEQAQGPQDIGESVTTVFGTTISAGSPLDFWFRGNLSPIYTNSFSSKTHPSTHASSGANTHITFDQISTAGTIMSLQVALGDSVISPVSGFPVDLSKWMHGNTIVPHVQSVDLDTYAPNGEELVIAAALNTLRDTTATGADTGFVFAFHMDGSNAGLGLTPRSPVIVKEPGVLEWTAPPAFGDIDGDGVLEMAIVGREASGMKLFIYRNKDLSNDGLMDPLFVIANVTSTVPCMASLQGSLKLVYTIRSAGTDVLVVRGSDSQTYQMPGVSSTGTISLAEAASDRVFIASENYQGFFTAGSGVFTSGVSWTAAVTRPATAERDVKCLVADLDGDRQDDGVALLPDRLVVVASSQHGLPVSSTLPTALTIVCTRPQMAAADINRDGRHELLIADSTRVLAFNMAAASIDYYPTATGARWALASGFNDDNCDAVFSVGENTLQQLGTNASPVAGFPVPLASDAAVRLLGMGSTTSPVLGVLSAGADGFVSLYKTGKQLALAGIVWQGAYADTRNSNHASVLRTTTVDQGTFFPADRCYNWPNPVYEGTTKIRFYVSEPASVTVKIYDIAGDKVDEFHVGAAGGIDNEIDWHTSGVQNGVYLAHVKAEAGSKSGEKIIKIAVVK